MLRRLLARLRSSASPAAVTALAPVLAPHDVTAIRDQIDLTALDVIAWTPAHLTRGERLLIFTLAFTLRPQRYLEIGTFRGGSALLVNAALQAADCAGTLICIDPNPQIAPEHWALLAPRARLLAASSPAILPEAARLAGAPFDLVFIDGDHRESGVLQDAEGVLPLVAPGGHLLFHDAFYEDVRRGIDTFVMRHPAQLNDLGLLSRECTADPADRTIRWGGLRLLSKKIV